MHFSFKPLKGAAPSLLYGSIPPPLTPNALNHATLLKPGSVLFRIISRNHVLYFYC